MNNQTTNKFHQSLAWGIKTTIRLWAGWNPLKILALWQRFRIFRKANQRRERLLEEEKIMVPPLIIFSPTMLCNLSCKGCYSRNYPVDDELSLDEISRLFSDAEDAGVGFFVITGGEPLIREGLMDLLVKHKNLIFFLFTNGSTIKKPWAEKVGRLKNIVPVISVEGDEKHTTERRGEGVHQQVMQSMAYLREAGAFFGFSSMVTTQNLTTLGEEKFYDGMIERGCRIGFCVGYVPSGNDADLKLVPTPEQQEWFRKRVIHMQQNKPMILIQLPDDEYEVAGTCMAAGRGFLHINAQGYVEPCPFSHIASDSIRKKPLKDVLQAPLFTYIREHSELLNRPSMGCALFENRDKLNAVADQLGAINTENIGSPRC